MPTLTPARSAILRMVAPSKPSSAMTPITAGRIWRFRRSSRAGTDSDGTSIGLELMGYLSLGLISGKNNRYFVLATRRTPPPNPLPVNGEGEPDSRARRWDRTLG